MLRNSVIRAHVPHAQSAAHTHGPNLQLPQAVPRQTPRGSECQRRLIGGALHQAALAGHTGARARCKAHRGVQRAELRPRHYAQRHQMYAVNSTGPDPTLENCASLRTLEKHADPHEPSSMTITKHRTISKPGQREEAVERNAHESGSGWSRNPGAGSAGWATRRMASKTWASRAAPSKRSSRCSDA